MPYLTIQFNLGLHMIDVHSQDPSVPEGQKRSSAVSAAFPGGTLRLLIKPSLR